MAIEIVDTPEKIAEFFLNLDGMIGEASVTLERVRVITCRHSDPD